MQAAHSGWLEKHSGGKSDGKFRLGNTLGKWDRRYFVLDEGGTLSYLSLIHISEPTRPY